MYVCTQHMHTLAYIYTLTHTLTRAYAHTHALIHTYLLHALATVRKHITLHLQVCNYLCYNLFSHTVLDNDLHQHLNGQVKDNQYYYRDHLLALDACHPLSSFTSSSVMSPLVLENWSRELSTHLGKIFAQYILRGISQSFWIGFNHSHHLSQPHSAMLTQNPEVIMQSLIMRYP